MAPHSSTLAWKIPWMEEPGGLQSMRSLRVDTTERLHFHFSLLLIGEGNANPLQCSCLENPRDGGARWAAVYGVAQSQTRLKWLSSNSSSSSSRCAIDFALKPLPRPLLCVAVPLPSCTSQVMYQAGWSGVLTSSPHLTSPLFSRQPCHQN